ncbi:MAG TPA: hypothetical protein VHC19_12920 [Pirellulales bacterium]|nr:hypothetical protein [Pirellulales bacterium]
MTARAGFTTLLAWQGRIEPPRAAIRRSVDQGGPLDGEAWTDRTLHALDLQSTIRPCGRPRKQPDY